MNTFIVPEVLPYLYALFEYGFTEYQLTTDITLFSKSDLKEYIKIQRDAEHKITSINTRLRAIRAFFNFLSREGYIERVDNPVANLKLLKDRQKVVQTYTNSEIKELFKVPNQSTFTGMRDLTYHFTVR